MKYSSVNGNGQMIFVEPTWVTGETCLCAIKDPITYAYVQSKLTKLRKNFLLELEKEGFQITYDKNDYQNDIIYFIMNDLALGDENTPVHIYKKRFDEKMFQAGGANLNYPYSITMEEFFEHPFFPAVLKNEKANGGIDKFLIETEEQLEIIKQFYNDFSNRDEYKDIFGFCIFQQLIETPTDHKTYLRVLMSASGDVMGASLKYSEKVENKKEAKGLLEKYFWDKDSKYFLDSKNMFNYYSGGGNISFSQPKYSYKNQCILEEHGIDPEDPMVPEVVLEVATNIMQNCNKELGIICGFDFILNIHDGKWYYLENQAFPAIEEWAITKGIRKIKLGSIEDSMKYFALDLEARHEALSMYMMKKQLQEENYQKQKINE